MISSINPRNIPVAALTDKGGLCDHRQSKVLKAVDGVTGNHPAMLDPITVLRALRLKRGQRESQLGARDAMNCHGTTPSSGAGDPAQKIVEVREGVVIQQYLHWTHCERAIIRLA